MGGIGPINGIGILGMGSSSNEQNPSYTYANMGRYEVTLTVTDSMGYSDTNYTWTLADKEDNNPPDVEITTPSGGIYLKDRKILPFFMPIIIWGITIEAEASDAETGIAAVAFYFDDELQFNDTVAPYTWPLNEYAGGMHEIKVIAYDLAMNFAVDSTKIVTL